MKRCTGSSRWTSGLARPGSVAVTASLDEGPGITASGLREAAVASGPTVVRN